MRKLMATVLLIGVALGQLGGGDGGSDYLIGSDGDATPSLTIQGERTSPSEPDSRSPEHWDSAKTRDDGPDAPYDPKAAPEYDNCRGVGDRRCARAPLPRPPAESGAGAPAITIADLATFSPAPVQPVAEPGNVGIAGMPANFVANATTHTQTGTLFGTPVTVRFTPSGYDFHYGDGTTSTLTTGGRTWASLGQPQFTPTATSHVYRARGTYIADVTVRYTAEVDLGTGWLTVPGELTTPGPTQQIRIFQAHTALVAHTCTEKPTAPGC